jgi:hypothetical protein
VDRKQSGSIVETDEGVGAGVTEQLLAQRAGAVIHGEAPGKHEADTSAWKSKASPSTNG